MISASHLRAIYEDGAIVSHLAGLEAVWDAAQLDILKQPKHHHKHPKPVTLCVPDPCQPALFAATHPRPWDERFPKESQNAE